MQSLEQHKSHDLSIEVSNTQLVLYNAVIYSHSHSDANAVVVENEQIIWLGDSRVAEQIYPHFQWIDLRGYWIAPLFVNGHYPLSAVNLKTTSYSGKDQDIDFQFATLFPDFSAFHFHAVGDSFESSSFAAAMFQQDSRYIFYDLPSSEKLSITQGEKRQAILVSEYATQQALYSTFEDAVSRKISCSILVSLPEEVDLVISVLSNMLQKFTPANFIASGLRFEYTIPCSTYNQAELARYNIPLCISGKSIVDHFTLTPVPQDLSLFMRAGNILALGFSADTLNSWDNLQLLAQQNEVFYPLSFRALFHAASRGGHRIAREAHLEDHEITAGAVANFAIWEVEEYITPDKNDAMRGRWSMDPRSHTPLLPQISTQNPRLWGRCYQGNLQKTSANEANL